MNKKMHIGMMKEDNLGKVTLRIWNIEDAPALAAALNNKKMLDNLRDGLPYPYTEEDAESFIVYISSAPKHTQYNLAVCVDGKVVGSIGVVRKDNVHRLTGELGYYVAEEYWGKGVMTEAVNKMCRYIFDNSDIVRIFAESFADNIASCRVLEKAGFQYEGTLRRNAIKNGQLLDMKVYAILKETE